LTFLSPFFALGAGLEKIDATGFVSFVLGFAFDEEADALEDDVGGLDDEGLADGPAFGSAFGLESDIGFLVGGEKREANSVDGLAFFAGGDVSEVSD
jgi:hypothetical protein